MTIVTLIAARDESLGEWFCERGVSSHQQRLTGQEDAYLFETFSFETSHKLKMSMILDLLEICIESCQIFISVTSSIW
jgi:hypothetical protein